MANIVEITVLARNATKEGFAAAQAESSSFSSKLQKVGMIGATALAAVAVASVSMAADFQSSTTKLVTSAGESLRNIDMVRKGMLDMAGQVGMSAIELSKGMYTVESAGYHGAAGLVVLKAAAQGAKDENAQLGTVANAVTDVLTDYHMKTSAAADVTSKLVTAVSFGKTNFEEFSTSMSNILPLAGVMHLKLSDVSGVLAEMTAHGVSAQRASENEADAMRHLVAPTGTMVKQFSLFGITTADVQKKLGSVGLGGTMEWLRGIADKGAASVGQTQTGAFKKLLGSAAALSVGLMTTGENFKSTQSAITGISGATADASGNVKGFSEVQRTFKQQLSEVGASAESLAIAFGSKMLPALTSTIGWMSSHQGVVADLAKAILALAAALAVVAISQKILNIVMEANPFILIGTAVIALAVIIIKYHKQIWDFITRTWRDVSSFVSRVWGDIYSFAKHWWPLILGPAGLIVVYHQQVWSFIRGLWNTVTGWLSSTWNTIFDNAHSIWGQIVGFFAGIPGKIIGFFKGLYSGMVGIGKGIVHGIIDGFKSVWDEVANFFTSLPGKILGWLGIHSPPEWSIDAGKHIAHGIGIGMLRAHGRVKDATQALAAIASKTVGGTAGIPAQGGPTAAQQAAMKMAALIGWTGNEWTALNNVAMRESGWSMTAQNPSSGAYGIAQFINGPSEYAQYGGNANTLGGQLIGFFNYIKQRYGDPASAWAHEQSSGWYASGGRVTNPWAVVGEQGRELVRLPGGSRVYNHAQSEGMLGGGSGGIRITLEIGDSFREAGLTDRQLKDIRATVRGLGGDVQVALGRN